MGHTISPGSPGSNGARVKLWKVELQRLASSRRSAEQSNMNIVTAFAHGARLTLPYAIKARLGGAGKAIEFDTSLTA